MVRYLPLSLGLHIIIISIIGIILTHYRTPNPQEPTLKIRIDSIQIKNQKTPKENLQPQPEKLPLPYNLDKKDNDPPKDLETTTTPGNTSTQEEMKILPPKLLYSPNINYPYLAKIKGIEGTLVLEITISTNGRIINYNVLKSTGYEILDKTGIEYIKQIVFEPAKDSTGIPIEFQTTYTIHFVLKK